MKKLVLLLLLLLVVAIGAFSWAQEERKPKIPHAGGNVTPTEAFKMLAENPEDTFLIDVRSMAEYELVGHPFMAYNIPYMFWTSKGMKTNPDFTKDVTEKFKKTDRFIVISRLGKHSCRAANKLVKAGFKRVYNMLDGFEGDKVKTLSSPDFGHRRKINGWQHDKLPYTYSLNKKFTYKLHDSCGCD